MLSAGPNSAACVPMEVVTPVVWGGRGVQGPGDKGNGSLGSNRQVLPKEWRGEREEGDGGGEVEGGGGGWGRKTGRAGRWSRGMEQGGMGRRDNAGGGGRREGEEEGRRGTGKEDEGGG